MGKIQGKPLALLLFVSILLGIFGACDQTLPKTGTLMDFVPENTLVVFKIANFESLQADIQNNALLSKFEKSPPYFFFSQKAALLQNLQPNSQSLLCINKLNDSLSAYTFITKQTKGLFQLDSLKNKTIETLKLDKQSFQRVTIGNEIAYSALVDSVFVLSSSQQILMDILEQKTERSETFSKVFNLPSSNEFTALVRGTKIALNDSTKIDFTSWSALDIAIAPDTFTATGITLATDSIPQLLNVFEGQTPQQNDASEIVPLDALGAVSFTFNDAEKFQKKLKDFRGDKTATATTGIFGSVSEVGSIQLKNETAIFIKSIDALLTEDALARYVSAKSSFRDIEISSFSEPQLFQKTFSPFINSAKANYVFQLENFFVFIENEATAEQLISAFQNNATLKNSAYFENTATNLSSASSLLLLKMQGEYATAIARFFNSTAKKSLEAISFNEFPLAALQFSYDRNFAHVTFSCNTLSGKTQTVSRNVSEKFNVKLENPVLGIPQIFNNKGSNVLVQDVGNKLHFISESGNILWTKNLGSGILGAIEVITISGNKFMAFATKDAFHILDRNGKDATSFPIKFKDAVTQPLSVFDYDNNGNYRFVIVQNNGVLMYDKNGKTVKGFGFDKAKSKIVQSPKHIRMGNKDYIVIAEESGKLNILSRVGKSRISVSKNFNFSAIPIAEEDNTFVVITKENTKERISQNGKITSQKLAVGSNYWFAINGTTKVTLDDNLLRINGKLVELPLGLYHKPQLFNIHRNTYITITETQEKKVYVFDKNGTLLNGFPVYGTSIASMSDGNEKNTLELTVIGESNSVILYSKN
ncbi:hypothetical protein [Aequorivita sp. Q41]|uniref:hypothetical protein n=1 Tax=Aequorivita sp. Q41 TaxID=3153300 RepID=UPI003241F572